MATQLFSKIRIRRGLKADLPDLSNAEFGFTTDTGEVFIGAPDLPSLQDKGRSESNEQFPYKNVQLITAEQNLSGNQPYIYVSNSDNVAQTGPSPSQPVQRSYQQKFDDFINLDDFITDETNISPDFNRALQQNHPYRKILRISAGNYNVNTPLELPPNSHIKGEGIDRTFLNHTINDPIGPTYIAETVDNKFQKGLNITFNGGGFPSNIIIEDLTITIPRLMDFIRLNRARNVTFRRVKFKGAGATTSTTNVFAFDKLGISIDMFNFKVEECEFEDVSNVCNNLDFVISNIKFRNNTFTEVFKLVQIDNKDVKYIEFSGNTVNRMFNDFIVLNKGETFKSFNNIFTRPNNNIPITVNSGFVDFNSYIEDFDIENNSPSSKIYSDSKIIYNKIEKSDTDDYNLLASTNTVLPITFDIDVYDSVKIHYIARNNSNVKMGTMNLTVSGGNLVFFDTGSSNGNMDVTFTGEINSNEMSIRYDNVATTTGSISLYYEAILKY